MSGEAAPRRARRLPLAIRHSLITLGLVLTAIAFALALDRRLGDARLAGGIATLLMVPLVLYAVRAGFAPVLAMLRALAGTVTGYRDRDFSFSLSWKRNDEVGDLVSAHNELGTALREERQGLVQRELLLDTMLQNTPVAMLLCDPRGRIVYANIAARKLLNGGRRMEGRSLDALLESVPALREALERGGDGLFAVSREDDEDDVYHLARRRFTLNGRPHELFLLRYLTAELRRQEVRTWKKVIRVISHELNNSLGPIGSLAHSGAELLRRGEHGRLEEIFAGIEERTRHLDGFIRGYASFAKLPAPRVEDVGWPGFIERLRKHAEFRVDEPLPDVPGRFDPAQLAQALLNLLRNSHESGSSPEDVRLRVRRLAGKVSIDVCDRGSGMSEGVLSSALLPFYSTKRGGTGLGLALVREIAEAHGGRVALANRDGGGLVVTVVIPE